MCTVSQNTKYFYSSVSLLFFLYTQIRIFPPPAGGVGHQPPEVSVRVNTSAGNRSAVPPGAPGGRTAVILWQISQTRPLTLVCSVLTALARPTADPRPVTEAPLGPPGFTNMGHLLSSGCVFWWSVLDDLINDHFDELQQNVLVQVLCKIEKNVQHVLV